MKTLLVVLALIPFSTCAFAGEYLMNDTGGAVIGLRVVFSEPVRITSFGDTLLLVDPRDESIEFIFSGSELEAWEEHWLNWEPSSVSISSHEWIVDGTEAADQLAVPIGQPSSSQESPELYLYVPRLLIPTSTWNCVDCKTYAWVSVMRYYIDNIDFHDVCSEVGLVPRKVNLTTTPEQDLQHMLRLMEFAESHGFVIETYRWNLEEILAEAAKGTPVILSRRIGDDPSEPGIVKGFNESHVWVYGIWEAIVQRDTDSVYDKQQLEQLLDPGSFEYGLGGYGIWPSPPNCIVLRRQGEHRAVPEYQIEQRTYGDHGVRPTASMGEVEPLTNTDDGKLSWSGPLREDEAKRIFVTINDSGYVVDVEGQPTVRFAVRFHQESPAAGDVIQGIPAREKKLWQNFAGYPFEEVNLPVTRSGDFWTTTVTIIPNADVESLYVLAPPISDPCDYFGLLVSILP